MKIKSSLKILLILIPIVLVCGAGSAFADDTFTIYKPDSASYLYLESPQSLATDGVNVAVYDSNLNRIIISGLINKSVDNIESVKSLALSGNSLIILNNNYQLFCCDLTLDTLTEFNTDEALLETPSLMSVCGDTIYLYNGHRTVTAISISTLTVIKEYKNNLLLYTKMTAVDGNNLYAVTFYNDLIKVELTSGTAELISSGITAGNIFAAGDGYALIYDDYIKIVSALFNGEYVLPDLSLKIETVSEVITVGNTIYILDNSNSVKVLTLTDIGLSFSRSFGSSGTALGMFDSPCSMVFSETDKLAVADYGNNRIQILTNNPRAYTGIEAVDLAWSGNVLYAVNSKGKIIKFEGETSTYINFSGTAKNIAVFNGTLFVSDTNGSIISISADGTETNLFKFSAAPISIATSKVGNIVYALTDTEIAGYTEGGKINVALDVSEYKISDFEVDFGGNIYALNNDITKSIIKFTRQYDGYVKSDETVLTNDIYELGNAVSLSMNSLGEFYVLSSTRHIIANVEYDFNPVLDYTAEAKPEIVINGSGDVSFGTVSNILIYAYTNNFEYVTPLKNTSVVVFKNFVNDRFYYVMTAGGNYGYIEKSALQASVGSVPAFKNIKMLHADGDKIYSYPSKDASSIAVDNQLPMEIIGNACNFTGSGVYWYEVKYELNGVSNTGFVLRTRVLEYNAAVITVEETTYAKVSAKLATNISLYYLADEQSGVIATLADGTKVQILEDINPDNLYTLVSYNGQQGYVLTSCLTKTNGLTNSQLVGILIAAFMVISTSIFLLISKNAKKLKIKNN